MRSTDLPFNTKTYMPEPLKQEEEITLQTLKNNLMNITVEYCNNNDIKGKNLTLCEKRGMKSLCERREKNECIIFPTDKTGTFSIDTPDNYIKAMESHVGKDIRTSSSDVVTNEKIINAHATFWTTMLQIAKDSGDQRRVKSSMTSHNSACSKGYGFRKDHKPYQDDVIGPPVRPMSDASDAYNHRLAYLICMFLEEVTQNIPTQCESTEDLMARVEEVNRSECCDEDTVIGSMDVKSLYPNLDIGFTIDIVCEEFHNSDIQINGIDYEEVGLYIAINREVEYINRKGLEEFCPKRKRSGRKIEMTGSGTNIDKRKRFEPWIAAQRQPDEITSKIMLKEAIKIVLEIILKNHQYRFNDIIWKQQSGGPIGLDLTGVIAKIFMGWWDRKLLEKFREYEIEVKMLTRLVDDINMCATATPPGSKIVGRKLEVSNEQIIQDLDTEKDKRTFSLIQQIGNQIHKSIQLEIDIPSNHLDKKVPMLDLKMWIDKNESNGKYQIIHEHYVKDIASQLLIRERSALAWAQKRTILTQQCLKVRLNCSRKLPQDRLNELLGNFCKRMQASGYDQKMRYEVMKSADNAYTMIRKDSDEGIRPMYRTKEWERTERRLNKQSKNKNWYKKGDNEAVIFVPSTPESKLTKLYKQTIQESKLNIKVVEKGGNKVKNILQRNDILSSKKCDSKDCFVCKSNTGINCRTSAITYKIKCKSQGCTYVYNGQTAKNGFSRGQEHIREYNNRVDSSVLWTHCQKAHSGEEQDFEMSVVDQCRHDPTKRQILEAIRINRCDPSKRMNDRMEWNYLTLPRMNVRN